MRPLYDLNINEQQEKCTEITIQIVKAASNCGPRSTLTYSQLLMTTDSRVRYQLPTTSNSICVDSVLVYPVVVRILVSVGIRCQYPIDPAIPVLVI